MIWSRRKQKERKNNEGRMICPGLFCSPPLNIERRLVDEALEIFEDALTEAERDHKG